MFTIKINYQPSMSTGGENGFIYYQVKYDKTIHIYVTDYKIFTKEWDKNKHCIKFLSDERKTFLYSIQDKIRCDVSRFNRVVISLMQKQIDFNAEDIVNEYRQLISNLSLFSFMNQIIIKLKEYGKIRTSETYRSAFNSFYTFRKGEDVCIDTINQEMMESYEAYLQSKGLVPNSTSFHLRILRAIYNKASEQFLIEKKTTHFYMYTRV